VGDPTGTCEDHMPRWGLTDPAVQQLRRPDRQRGQALPLMLRRWLCPGARRRPILQVQTRRSKYEHLSLEFSQAVRVLTATTHPTQFTEHIRPPPIPGAAFFMSKFVSILGWYNDLNLKIDLTTCLLSPIFKSSSLKCCVNSWQLPLLVLFCTRSGS